MVDLTKSITADSFVSELESSLPENLVKSIYDVIDSEAPFAVSKFIGGRETFKFAEKYLSDANFRSNIKGELPSNFHKSLLDKSVAELATAIDKTLKNVTFADLEKAVKAKDWNRVANKHNADAPLVVDHKPHMSEFPVHEDYNKILSSNDQHKSHKIEDNGISAKMIHAVHKPPMYTDLYMAKPYHKNIESATKSWVKHPILGWSTMATKALYNAGGIGKLAEDVSAHEHQGIPLTVHKFAPDHVQIGKLVRYGRGGSQIEAEIDPLQVHQIGVMDYLTNNMDRHHGNLMVNTRPNDNHKNDILAIDHERSFQYAKPLRESKHHARVWSDANNQDVFDKETPWSYIKLSALNSANRSYAGWHSHEDLLDWWGRHGSAIKDKFDEHVQHIKDDTIRQHVKDNFHRRWHKMQDWHRKMTSDPDGEHMWDQKALHNMFDDVHTSKIQAPRITAKQLKSLPKNPRDAMFAIADLVNKKPKMTFKQRQILGSAMHQIMESMSPQDAAESLKSLVHNPYMSTKAIKSNPDLDPRHRILNHFSQAHAWDADHNPVYKHGHMEALADMIDGLPEDKKETLKAWSELFRQKSARARGAA